MRQLSVRLGIFAIGLICGWLASRWIKPSVNSNAPVACVAPAPAEEKVVAPREPAAVAHEPSGFGPPIFRQAGVIQSTLEGYLLVRWIPTQGADKYHVEVQDDAGKAVRSYITNHNYTYIRDLTVDPNLGETHYRVQVVPIGATDEKGRPSEWKRMVMLPMKDLAPPTIKSITTED